MKKFRFKFETVLKVRKSREDDVLRALGSAQRSFQEEISKKEILGRALEAALLRREGLGREPVSVLAFQMEQDFINGTKQRMVQADHAIARAKKSVEKALRAYLQARRQTKMMETLRDKDFADFRKAQSKREQREMDELSIMRERLREKIA